MAKYTIISERDFKKLISDGYVKYDDDYDEYVFMVGMPYYIPMNKIMKNDLITSRRRKFDCEELDMSEYPDPYVEGISGEYHPWFLPCWCIVEWLEYREKEII